MLPLIASLSGGKDSTAMALWLREKGIEFRAVFMDTGWEAPETYEYLDYLERVLGQRIERVRGPWTFESLAIHKGAFPIRKYRFCTSELKIKPFLAWVAQEYPAAEIVNAVGIRALESQARRNLPCVEPMGETLGQVVVWRPLLSWSEQDVIDYHKDQGVAPNPLYLRGHRRVGCYPCIFGGKAGLRQLSSDRIDRISRLESAVGERCASRKTSKYTRAQPPYMFSLRDRNGKHHTYPIAEVIRWARTAHGGKQYTLTGTEERGCMRWGMCE